MFWLISSSVTLSPGRCWAQDSLVFSITGLMVREGHQVGRVECIRVSGSVIRPVGERQALLGVGAGLSGVGLRAEAAQGREPRLRAGSRGHCMCLGPGQS